MSRIRDRDWDETVVFVHKEVLGILRTRDLYKAMLGSAHSAATLLYIKSNVSLRKFAVEQQMAIDTCG